MGRNTTKAMLRFLRDERFAALMTAADRGILAKGDLDNFDMPDGFTCEETWEILTAIRKQMAFSFPDAGLLGPGGAWYVQTSALSERIKELELKCAEGNAFGEALHEYEWGLSIRLHLMRVVEAAFKADGVTCSLDRLAHLYNGNLEPQTPVDYVAKNVMALFDSVHELAKRPFTLGFLEMVHCRIVEGVDLQAIHFDESFLSENNASEEGADARAIEGIVELAEGKTSRASSIPPVLRIICISQVFCGRLVFGVFNALTGLVVKAVLAVKWNLPVVGLLSSSSVWLSSDAAWAQSVKEDMRNSSPEGTDLTNAFLAGMDTYLEEARSLERTLNRAKATVEKLEQIFSFPMNARQRFIMSAFCKNPLMEATIETHQSSFDISYSTARKDFADLEQEGYLAKTRQGKYTLYSASPALRERLLKIGAASSGTEALSFIQ